MSRVPGGREHQLAGQGQAGGLVHGPAGEVHLAGDDVHGVLGGSGGYSHHHVSVEYVLKIIIVSYIV